MWHYFFTFFGHFCGIIYFSNSTLIEILPTSLEMPQTILSHPQSTYFWKEVHSIYYPKSGTMLNKVLTFLSEIIYNAWHKVIYDLANPPPPLAPATFLLTIALK